MITLGIETSCDETSCALLENGRHLRANIISSSLKKHKPFGGVVPEIASRHCLEAIHVVYREALKKARLKARQIDLIAVTKGPGLVGSLLVGVSFAKSLAFALEKPLVGVNHLEAHVAANFIDNPTPKGSYLGVVVSGGHTSLLKIKRWHFKEIGCTVDDAIGEAYDKTAKILGLGYPGGPAIDRLAQKGNPRAYTFTQPKVAGRYQFSFSGIKTAVLHHVHGKNGRYRPGVRWQGRKLYDLCASFQQAVTDWVIKKAILACQENKLKQIVVGGGVSANSRLRNELSKACQLHGIKLLIPPLALTLDNAGMIAKLGYERYRLGMRSGLDLTPNPSLDFE
ncbi:MAG: tRNA (adenosine(37)-N6)-threonylcarbamoyltransferase complex transferase subunit TsaD [Candidatus Omnitrophica bacterium CG11_big_fil_rev_8_21_14_0_20_45_26]|uniref:tRNA N6-adenosine threonylcarbamoyltransferase n=1 Tax=Candidatus Abzuiibacterium crystallinum TaxID=1974748 RepID=A0A2H0LN52_9BACT|nr:MAG: tRNA (adenosine(37)-N6)-threonylcarbamoyltransferase complex transferase subunit TsaD [Candidatus Omnitrophica bacterium CG11_big_fil_rev_8_21_14_0_20_45_26]PIW65073.1 MAG: tRNA (adenosine(37)-N6)-threonylcarbamoyltransferase complex transferase subunit TsaD [Candidatus Omnitrophica bacterium CG12_big_fil_rev_8_21_14_0_65_45_16]